MLIELKNLVCILVRRVRYRRCSEAPLARHAGGTRRGCGRRLDRSALGDLPAGRGWMLTCPASMVLVVRDDDDFELLPHPA